MSPTATARAAPHPPARSAPVADPALSLGSEDGLEVSEAVYWTEYYLLSDIHYEWNRGRLEEKPVSDYETFQVYRWLMVLLERFFETHPIGALVALEMGFRLKLPDGVLIRKPDFGVVRHDNPQPLLPLDVSYHGVFDLCVEALSDGERRGIERDTVRKKADYAAGGVPEYYILHREPELQAFFVRTATGVYVPLAPVDGVIESRALPGFRFRVEDLCRRPAHSTLRDDPVYADFVLPEWAATERRAAAETQRAEAEREAREAAEQRAEAEREARETAEQRAKAEAQRAEAEVLARQRLELELAALRARLDT
jgi:hypothetical protein